MSAKKRSKTKGIVSVSVALIILLLACFLYFNRQWVVDEINYLEYKPSTDIASFADKSSMNNEGKFLFYSAHPSLLDRTDFNKSCPSYSADTAILGCYDGQKIYIYDITDSQLDGIREETAAYEMLHAAYKRLSDSDRTKLDALIETEYAKQKNDTTDKSVAYFDKFEPGERDDELFSVIATQFSNINPDLEAYYSRYFTNRQVLVSLYNQYSSVFTNLETQSNTLSDQLTQQAASIKADEATYNTDNAQLSADITTFNNKASTNGGFHSEADYNTQRTALLDRIDALNNERDAINNEIATYNTTLNQYNSLALQVQQLNQAIDSSVAPAPSLQ